MARCIRSTPAPGRVSVIALQQGEELVTVSAGDTVRWIVGDTASGSGTTLRVNILVKPTRAGLKTNLVVTTNRRTYLLGVVVDAAGLDGVGLLGLSEGPHAGSFRSSLATMRQTAVPVASGVTLEQIRFRYAISGDAPPWKPLRAFDDGERVYIQFPRRHCSR